MAKKRDPFKQNFDVNADWDIDKLDSFESKFDDVSVSAHKPKGRKPLEDTGKYATALLKGTSLGTLKTLHSEVKKHMPKTAAIADQAFGFTSDVRGVTQEVMRSGGMLVNQTKQLMKTLAPKLKGIAPDFVQKKVEKLGESVPDDINSGQTLSADELRSRAIQKLVADSLKLQTQQASYDADERRTNTFIDRKLTDKRHEGLMDVLKNINREAEYRTEFFRSTTTGYYTKSLELQYKQLFVTKDMLSSIQVLSRVVEDGMKGLLHNSALPDIQKQRMTESYKNVARGAILNKFNSKLSNLLTGYGSRFAKNLGSNLKQGMDNLNGAVQQAQMGAEFSDIGDQLGGGMSAADKRSAIGKLAMQTGGQELGNWLVSKIDPKLLSKVIRPLARGPENMVKGAQNRAYLKLKELDENRNYGGMKNSFKNFILDTLDLKNLGTDRIENVYAKKPTDTTSFDVATRTSIVEIIPGYLAKILQQVSIANGGSAEESVYDEDARDFVSASEYKTRKVNQMHREKQLRAGTPFAKGAAAVHAGIRHHAGSQEAYQKDKVTFEEIRKDIEIVIKNVAAKELLFHPEIIKEYSENADTGDTLKDAYKAFDFSDMFKSGYIGKVFAGIKQPVIVAKFLTRSMYMPDGSKNIVVIRDFEAAIADLMGDDGYKDKLMDMVNSFGKGRYFKDHIDQKSATKFGDLKLDKNSIIDNYKRDYNTDKYMRNLGARERHEYNKLQNDGFSANDILQYMPNRLQRHLGNRLTDTQKNRRFFATKKFNDIDYDGVQLSPFAQNIQRADESTMMSGRRRGGRIVNNYFGQNNGYGPQQSSMTTSVVVTGTTGENVLLRPLVDIGNKISDGYQKTDKHAISESDQHPTDIMSDIKMNTLAMVEQLTTMRQENKAIAIAQAETTRVAAGGTPSNNYGGMWKAIGTIGSGVAKGTGSAIGGTYKALGHVLSTVSVPALKAAGAIIPGLARGAGSAIGGIAGGAGTLGAAAIRGNVALMGMAMRGVGHVVGGTFKHLFGRKQSGSEVDDGTTQSASIQDVYAVGSEEPVLTKKDILAGVYTKAADGSLKMVKSIKDISGAVYNASGDMLVSKEQLANGLYDKLGKKFDFSKVKMGNISGVKDTMSQKAGLLGTLGKGAFNTAKHLGKNMLMMPGSLTGSMMGLGMGGLKWAGQTVGGLAHKLLGIGGTKGVIDEKVLQTQVSDKLDVIIQILKANSSPKSVLGDIDGDGIREGSYQDYMRKKADKKAAAKSSDGNSRYAFAMGPTSQRIDSDDSGGLLSTLFDLVGGTKLKEKFLGLKNKLLGKIGGMFKGFGGLMGKGLSGLLGIFFGGSAIDAVMGSAGGIAGSVGTGTGVVESAMKASSSAAKLGEGAMAGAKVAGVAGGAAASTATGKVASILEKAKKYIPDKVLKFFKVDKVAPGIAKKLGPKTVTKFAMKFLTGPVGWVVAGASMTYSIGKAIINAKEILGIPDSSDLSISDRLITGLAVGVSDLFLGLVDVKWLAEEFGVDTSSYLKKAYGEAANDFKESRDPTSFSDSYGAGKGTIDTTKTGATREEYDTTQTALKNSTVGDEYDDALDYVKRNSGQKIPPKNGPSSSYAYSTGAVPSTGGYSSSGQSSPTFDVGNIKPVQSGTGSDMIGEFVKKFESGSDGPMSISWDSTGGTSYGTYQFAGRSGIMKEFIQYCEQEGGSEGKEAAKLMKTVRDWDVGQNWQSSNAAQVWRALAKAGYIGKLEHAFTMKKKYLPALKKLPQDLQAEVGKSRGLQEMLWSMVVQHGPGNAEGTTGAPGIWKKHWQSGMKVEDFVKKVYVDRGNYFSSSTPKVQQSVRNRFKEEVGVVLGLLDRQGVGDQAQSDSTTTKPIDAVSGSSGSSDSTSTSTTATSSTSNNPADASGATGSSSNNNTATAPSMTGSSNTQSTDRYANSGMTASQYSSNQSALMNSAFGEEYGNAMDYVRGNSGSNSNGDMSGIKVQGGADFNDVHPALKERFMAMSQEYLKQFGQPITVTSGKRSLAQQKKLFDQYGPGRAARPNPLAPHIAGVALDANSSDMEKADSSGLLQKYGLWRPLKNGLGGTQKEAWHVELMGSRDPSTQRITEGTLANINSKYGAGVSPDSGSATGGDDDPSAKDTSADGASSESLDAQAKKFGGDMSGGSSTQRTTTPGGTTTIPPGGGAGTTASSAAASMTSGVENGSYTLPNSPTNNMTQSMIDILTAISEFTSKIADNTESLQNLDKLVAGNNAAQSGSSSKAATTSTETSSKPVNSQTPNADRKAPPMSNPPIDTSAKTVNRSSLT